MYPQFRQSSRTVLPPSSSQSFLKERKDIPVVLLTNYETEYSNQFYHSIFDNSRVNNYNYSSGQEQSVVRHLSSVCAAVSSAVLTAATGSTPALPDAGELVNELLHCYTETANCSLFKEASSPLGYPWTDPSISEPLPQYVSVHTSGHTMMTKQVLQYLTGEVEVQPEKPITCLDVYCGLDEVKSLADQQLECLAQNKGQEVFKYNFFVGKPCYNATGM